MCCTFEKSEMSDTKIYVGEAQKNNKLVHVLAYQNKATSKGPNAMVLPFPTKVKMGPANVIDTRPFKYFLDDITEANRQITKGMRRLGSVDSLDRGVQIFDVGSYTVLLADSVYHIPWALSEVVEEKRPDVRVNFLHGYNKLYPKQPIAMCCWNGAIEAEPLLWWYEPSDPSKLFIPTMDAHDGQAPKVGAQVRTDHHISVGTVGHGHTVRYRDNLPDDVRALLPKFVAGTRVKDVLPNDDSFVKTSTLTLKTWLDTADVLIDRHGLTSRMYGWS